MWYGFKGGGGTLNGVNFRFSGAMLSDELAVLFFVDDLPGGALLWVIRQGHPAESHVLLRLILTAHPTPGTAGRAGRAGSHGSQTVHGPSYVRFTLIVKLRR